jgi:hypothetical protein
MHIELLTSEVQLRVAIAPRNRGTEEIGLHYFVPRICFFLSIELRDFADREI